jgi:hypothetical protein
MPGPCRRAAAPSSETRNSVRIGERRGVRVPDEAFRLEDYKLHFYLTSHSALLVTLVGFDKDAVAV